LYVWLAVVPVAALPALMLVLPGGHQAADRRRRKAGRVRSQQDGERLLELTRGDALQVQPGQQLLDVPGAPQVGWQHRGGETDALALIVRAAVANPRPLDLDRADPGRQRSLRRMAVAHQAPSPRLVVPVGMHREKVRNLGLDRQAQHLPRPFTQDREQRVVLDGPSWPRQLNDGILFHGVSFHR
jgi:hypothetical protein